MGVVNCARRAQSDVSREGLEAPQGVLKHTLNWGGRNGYSCIGRKGPDDSIRTAICQASA